MNSKCENIQYVYWPDVSMVGAAVFGKYKGSKCRKKVLFSGLLENMENVL